MPGWTQTEILPAAGTAPAAIDKAPASAWYALAVLIGVTLFAFVDRQVINLIAPTLQTELGLSDLQLGVMQGLGLALFASAAGYPIGWLSDRFGRRLVLGCCVMFWAASTAACAFQTSFEGIFAATAGIAIGEAALSPILFSMLPDLFPERQRNTANFILFGAVLLGAAAGIGLGSATLGWLENNHHVLPGFLATMDSWRAALILVAIPAPIFVGLLATIRMRTSVGRVIAKGGVEARAELDKFLPYIRIHWPAVVCVYGAIAGYGLAGNSALTWLPVALPRVFAGMDAGAIGVPLGSAIALGSIAGLALPAICSKLMRGDTTTKPLYLARIFMIAGILPTLVMPFVWAPWVVFVAAGSQFALVVATGAMMPGLLQQLSPPGLRSRLLSILGIVSAITGGLSPLLVGMISGLFRWPTGIFLAMGIVGLAGWALGAFLISLAPRYLIATAAAVRETES